MSRVLATCILTQSMFLFEHLANKLVLYRLHEQRKEAPELSHSSSMSITIMIIVRLCPRQLLFLHYFLISISLIRFKLFCSSLFICPDKFLLFPTFSKLHQTSYFPSVYLPRIIITYLYH